MKPSDAILGKMEIINEIVKRNGYKNPRIFGSVCKSQDHEGSDLDILVEKGSENCTLINLGTLCYELEEVLGIDIDVKLISMIPEKWRNKVLEESIEIGR